MKRLSVCPQLAIASILEPDRKALYILLTDFCAFQARSDSLISRAIESPAAVWATGLVVTVIRL